MSTHPAHRRTKAGSIGRRIAEAIWARSQELGRGVEIAEIREAYRKLHGDPPPRSLTAQVHSMKRRGVLVVVGGRPGHTLFALPGSEVQEHGAHPTDDAILVLQALERRWQRTKQPAATRHVAEELRAMGSTLDSSDQNAVRKYLETLARETVRGPEEFRSPRVQRITTQTEIGSPATYWVPAGESFDPSILPPRSQADAVRRAVREASSTLGRPVSLRELRWWLDTFFANDVVHHSLERQRLGTLLVNTARADAAHEGQSGRIHTVRTPFTGHGAGPKRYASGPPAARALALCQLEDAAGMLRMHDEEEGIAQLERRAEYLGSEALRILANIRRDLLSHAVHEALGDADIQGIASRVARVSEELRRWLESGSLTRHQRESREHHLAQRERDLNTAIRIAKNSPEPTSQFLCRAGISGFFNLSELDEPIASICKQLGVEAKRGKLIERARRFPATVDQPARRLENSSNVDLSLVDRVDAVVALFDLVPAPRANVLLSHAELLLGHVLRDVRVLLDLFYNLTDEDPFVRRALLVAIGVLGYPVELDDAGVDLGTTEDISAWILSVVLADRPRAEERIREADRRVRGTARNITDIALMRLRLGSWFSVVG